MLSDLLMGSGAKFDRFIALLERGTPQAFQQILGDPKVFQQKLSIYLSKFTMVAGLLPPAQAPDAKCFPAKHPPLQPAPIPTNKQESSANLFLLRYCEQCMCSQYLFICNFQ